MVDKSRIRGVEVIVNLIRMKSAKIESLEALRVALFVAVFLFHAGGHGFL